MTNYMYFIDWCKDNLFEVYVVVSILILTGMSLYRYWTNQRGKWCTPFKAPPAIQSFGGAPPYTLSAQHYHHHPPSPTTPTESTGESTVREFLCRRFNRPFTKVRNLYNPVTGSYLEIDCYNDELKLGVEYQGIQHYKYTPFFHKSVEAFRNQMYRDELKRIYCRDANIRLIHVPYTVKPSAIPQYLETELRKILGPSA